MLHKILVIGRLTMKIEKSNLSIVSGKYFEEVYNHNNYLIEFNENKSDYPLPVAVIYFSSSGIYYPNTIDALKKAFIDTENKFEFYKSDLKIKADKNIYIRDIAKQFYITGISKQLPSMDAVIDFLKEQTEGYELYTVGSSAGAYAAALAGCILGAKLIYCFSGYFDLNVIDTKTWFYIDKFKNDSNKSKYFNLIEYIKGSSSYIIYFYPGQLPNDVEQSQFIKNLDHVISIKMDSNVHGLCCSRSAVKCLMKMESGEAIRRMKDFSVKYSNQVIKNSTLIKYLYKNKWFFYYTKDIIDTILKQLNRILKKIYSGYIAKKS